MFYFPCFGTDAYKFVLRLKPENRTRGKEFSCKIRQKVTNLRFQLLLFHHILTSVRKPWLCVCVCVCVLMCWCGTHPVHVESEEDLVHIAVGVLAHALQAQDGLQLEQRDEA